MYKLLRKNSYKGNSSAPFGKKDDKSVKTLPNSLVMRIMEEPEAEKEADRLSQGISSQTPDGIMREMGSRLGADFSDVRFHTDPGSAEKGEQMGACAWAQGRDVYFGKGGFEPAIAAHELVHTVQQGAVDGNTSESIPMGAIQMKPMGKDSRLEDDEVDEKLNFDANADYRVILAQIFNTKNGNKIYHALEKDLYKLIRKGAGRGFRRCTKKQAIEFLVQAAEMDYTGKTVLANIMRMSTETDHFARKRLFDYQEFVQFLSNRLKESDLEEAAMGANVMTSPPKYEHKNGGNKRKRAYQLQVPGRDSEEIDFNPTNDPELEKVQQAIDLARNDREAYSVFARFTGSSDAKYVNKTKIQTNLKELKTKLKNMARVIRDYPEMQGQIGDMNVSDPKKEKWYMGAVGTNGGLRKAQLHYNSFLDTDAGREQRDNYFSEKGPGYLAGNTNFAGNHELGHVLVTTLIDTNSRHEANLQQVSAAKESEIMESVLSDPQIMPAEDYQNLKRYKPKDAKKYKSEEGIPLVNVNAIDTRKNALFSKGYTSRYGAEAPTEFFAEAVHDVYANGDKAKKTSIAVVEEYEKRQKKLTNKKFFRKKRGLWTRFRNWMKM